MDATPSTLFVLIALLLAIILYLVLAYAWRDLRNGSKANRMDAFKFVHHATVAAGHLQDDGTPIDIANMPEKLKGSHVRIVITRKPVLGFQRRPLSYWVERVGVDEVRHDIIVVADSGSSAR